MDIDLRRYVMPVRKDWNAMGPNLPAWFRVALRRVDRKLALQYFPPATLASGGVNATMYPCGVWVVCRRMPRTGWLHSSWVLGLYDEITGMIRLPTMKDINDIKRARNLWRRSQKDHLSEEFDRSCAKIMQARTEESRDHALVDFADCMRKHNFAQHKGSRIRVPA